MADKKSAKDNNTKAAVKKSQSGKPQTGGKSSGKAPAKKGNPVVKYFKDLKSEFKKVVWPSKKAVINNTGAVIASMVICGLAIWGLDSAFAALLRGLLSMAG